MKTVTPALLFGLLAQTIVLFPTQAADLSLEEASDSPGLVWTTGSHPGLAQTSALLVLLNNETVFDWGTNNFLQTDVPPEFVPPLGGAVAISAGDYHSLVLGADGTLSSRGDNRYGQTAVPEGLADVAGVAGGRAHTVALLGPAPPRDAPSLIGTRCRRAAAILPGAG